MTIENPKTMPPISADSVQGLLYALEIESAKDAQISHKTAFDSAHSYLKRVQKLRQDVLAKSRKTLNAVGMKDALKARLAEITARQILEAAKKLLRTNLKTATDVSDRQDKIDRRIRLILNDIDDSKTQSTTERSANESVWQACVAPASVALALAAEVEGSHDAKMAATRELADGFAAANRAWDGQKNAITRQLSALQKIKLLQNIFRVLSAVVLPLASFLAPLLAPTSLMIATLLKTAAGVLLQMAACFATKPAIQAAEDGKARERQEAESVQNLLAHAQASEARETKQAARRDRTEEALFEALKHRV